jgi:hypothetical protein
MKRDSAAVAAAATMFRLLVNGSFTAQKFIY